MTTNFYLGANSGEGFASLYDQLGTLDDTYDRMVLKGGPGVGKSTFIKTIGKAMEEAGTDVEYLWCPGDPDSLDGIVLPQLRCSVVDGTAPHAGVQKSTKRGPSARRPQDAPWRGDKVHAPQMRTSRKD